MSPICSTSVSLNWQCPAGGEQCPAWRPRATGQCPVERGRCPAAAGRHRSATGSVLLFHENRTYGISVTGACQNAALLAFGSRTVTWQLYSPAGSFPSGTLKRMGTAFDLGFIP